MNSDKEIKLKEKLADLDRYTKLLPTLQDRADREFFITGIRTIGESLGMEWLEKEANELLLIRLSQGYTIPEILNVCCISLDPAEDYNKKLYIGCLYGF